MFILHCLFLDGYHCDTLLMWQLFRNLKYLRRAILQLGEVSWNYWQFGSCWRLLLLHTTKRHRSLLWADAATAEHQPWGATVGGVTPQEADESPSPLARRHTPTRRHAVTSHAHTAVTRDAWRASPYWWSGGASVQWPTLAWLQQLTSFYESVKKKYRKKQRGEIKRVM